MNETNVVAKNKTGIPGFDSISSGGLPQGRTTLVSGTAGSGKTIFAAQFLAEGVRSYGQKGVFVTFEEAPADIRRNMASLGWPIAEWEESGKWLFVDGTSGSEAEGFFMEGSGVSGSYDLDALLARIERAVTKISAERVAVDSIGAMLARFPHQHVVRSELHRLSMALRQLGVTAIITAERTDDRGAATRYGVEEFVADNLIVLRNSLEEEKRRRTVEILKFRGARHHKGEFPFTILSDQGIVILPLASIELKHPSSSVRIPTGVPELDTMCRGGFFRDSIGLVSGATGTGKTLLTAQFCNGGIANGERVILFGFEESPSQIFRNAEGWGIDLAGAEKAGNLRVVSAYPESTSLEELYISIRSAVDEFKPHRIAMDSLSALERVSSQRGFREFVIGLASMLKERQIAVLMTATTTSLTGSASVTESHISTLTDLILMLRYVEMSGEVQRSIMVLKMRGSMHDKSIRRYTIDGAGMHIGPAFREVSGIIAGHPVQYSAQEMERIQQLFGGKEAPDASDGLGGDRIG